MFTLVWFLVASVVGSLMMFQVLATGNLLVALIGVLVASSSAIVAWLEYRFNYFMYYRFSMVQVFGVNTESEM